MAADQTPPAAERTSQGVQRMFDRVAPRYDLANTVFSMGQDKGWRVAAARATRLAAGEVAVDVACGTGGLARELETLAPGATVAGFDFSLEMLAQGPRARVAAGDDCSSSGGSCGPAAGWSSASSPPRWSRCCATSTAAT